MEVVIHDLPGRSMTLSDGTKVAEAVHPLKQFVFDKTGRIYVNVGAPTDSCVNYANRPLPRRRRAKSAGLGLGLHAAGRRIFRR